MVVNRFRRPDFRVTHEAEPSERLVAGFSSFGLAGLTAVDFLVQQLDLRESGYVTTETLPTITPFANGTPRHHTRLYTRPKLDLTILVNELPIPIWAADPFAEAVLGWTDSNGIQEITVLNGVPIPHGPEEHDVFYVASEDYQATRLANADIRGMGQGYLDGVNASLLGRGMDTDLRVGVLVTPVHEQVPDVGAALRLVEAVERLYGIEVDTDALEQFAGEVERYYRDLESRLEDVDAGETPEDRMYM